MSMELMVLTHLDKVFQNEAPIECTCQFQDFGNEKIDFQLTFRGDEDDRQECQLTIHSTIERCITARQVQQVPVARPVYDYAKEDCLRVEAWLYPDLLTRIRPPRAACQPEVELRVEPRGEVQSGVYPVEMTISNDCIAPFLQHQVPGRRTYYCCLHANKVSNMFIAFLSYRNRILGVQLFKYRVEGFPH